MKSFEKGPSPSKSSAKRNLSSSGSEENNENDIIVDELIPQFENQKISYGRSSVSGASRKKILAESNGTLSNSVDQGRKIERAKDDSSFKVYDPVMNYLSPRPQYLRFNPNRRQEIFKRLEKEMNGSLDSSLSPSVNQRNERVREEVSDDGGEGKEEVKEIGDNGDGYEMEEEDEGETEERGWCLGVILKLLLTLIGCLLSTSYTCCMNSSTHSPTQLAIWDFKNSSVVIKNGTLAFFDMDLQDHGFFEVSDGGGIRSTEVVEVKGENDEGFDESIEADFLEYLDEKEMIGHENEGSEVIIESMEAENVECLELDEKERNNNEVEDAELEYVEDVIMNVIIDGETDEDLDSVNVKNDSAFETEIIGFAAVDSEARNSGRSIDSKGEDDTESLEEKVGSNAGLSSSVDEADDAGVEMEKSELNSSTAAVVSAVFIVSASLAIIYRSKGSRISTSAKESKPVLEQKLAIEENVLPSIDRKVEFLARAPLSSHSEREPSKLIPHIHAPIVELIGEIVVGREPSSLRNSGKFQMTISEEVSNATMSEKLSLPRPVLTPAKPSAVDPGSASFQSPTTDQRNISRKEGSKIREAMTEATPVRRSSRLRNRPAVISP